ncbi:hypothetical protein AB2J21_13225 [Aeromonas sp. A3]
MERWDDKSKTMHRNRIEQVADKTHSLVLVGKQGGAWCRKCAPSTAAGHCLRASASRWPPTISSR